LVSGCAFERGWRLQKLHIGVALSILDAEEKASAVGLEFKRRVELFGDEFQGPITDSFGSFLGGAYSTSWPTAVDVSGDK
jgi:hypothetical protein